MDDSNETSSVGSIPTIPAPAIKLERFEDYGYSEVSTSISRRNSGGPLMSRRSSLGLAPRAGPSLPSTDASLSRRVQSGLTIKLPEENTMESPCMYDQAYIHTRDLM